MQKKILIIDDDIELCQLLKKCLEKENIASDCAHIGTDGFHLARQGDYQLIVLDVMLPKMDGFQILENIRSISSIPVLMLTAKTERTDKVNGLRAGADDYLTKPFDIEEFTARVQSLIRRYTVLNVGRNDETRRLVFSNLVIDADTRIVTVGGVHIELHPKEFDILFYLAKNQGKILTKQQIYEEVWNEAYAYDDSNIMGYISKIRKFIEININHPTYIQTVKGVGYRFSREV